MRGKIAERGTHDKLLRKKGVYSAMWNRQREADQARSLLSGRANLDERGTIRRGQGRLHEFTAVM